MKTVLKYSLAAFCLIQAPLLPAAFAQEPALTSTERTITIEADGVVTAEPNIAILRAGVVSEAETAQAALADNSQKMQAVMQSLQTLNVETRDIQTSNLSIDPRYVYPERNTGDTPPRLVGYTVSNMVTVRFRDLSALGNAVDTLVSSGVNQLSSLSFDIDPKGNLLDEARKKAVQEARRKAELLTSEAGVELGKVLTINEVSSSSPVAFKAMRAELAPGSTPIASGEAELSVRVRMTFSLEDSRTQD
jgi:uncharacterized protein YggE